jgi:aspartyl-tRNA(Asn)/glutamyl-tRNA(Gln) amidotransferase subunit A
MRPASSRRATRLRRFFARIEAVNPDINAIVSLDIAGARRAADESHARWRGGAALGAFDGIPLTVKDNIPVRGIRATWGSRIYADHVPEKDELPVARLRDGGAVIFGKTNCPEFTLQGYTDNLVFGVTRNPWDRCADAGRLERRRGRGRSRPALGRSRSAPTAADRSAVPPRIPGWSGSSLRATRSARQDGFPVILLDCEVIGPIARTVADARALFHALAGTKVASAVQIPTRSAARSSMYGQFGGSPVDPEIAASVGAVVSDLEAAGTSRRGGRSAVRRRCAQSRLAGHQPGRARLAAQRLRRPAREVSQPMQEMARAGRAVAATDYYAAIAIVLALRQQLAAFFSRYDLILTPTIAALSWPAAEPFPPTIAGQAVGPRGHAVFTAFANMAGCPAISIPCAARKMDCRSASSSSARSAGTNCCWQSRGIRAAEAVGRPATARE